MPKRKQEPPMRPPATPKYPAVQFTYDILATRTVAIAADTGLAKNVHRLKYYQKMEKMRRRVGRLLKAYPQYTPETEPHDPTTAKISDELEKSMKRLATPTKKFVKSTLIKINTLIKDVKDDHQFQKNPLKLRRVCELIHYRKQVCCLYSNYPASPEPSQYCFRFKPCSAKPAAIYAFDIESRNPYICINSRMLEFCFDPETIELALPNYRRIVDTLEFYKNLVDRLKFQIVTFHETKERKEKLGELLSTAMRRKSLLECLKVEVECRRDMEVEECKEVPKSATEGIFDKEFKCFTPFTHFLELPSRYKLQEVLKLQMELLGKTNSEIEAATRAGQKRPNSARLVDHLEKNILFIINVLECYPIKEKEPHCPLPVVTKLHGDDKKIVNVEMQEKDGKSLKKFLWDCTTDELSFPKFAILVDAERKYREMLSNFEADVKNATALARPDEKQEETQPEPPEPVDTQKPTAVKKQTKQKPVPSPPQADQQKKADKQALLEAPVKQKKKSKAKSWLSKSFSSPKASPQPTDGTKKHKAKSWLSKSFSAVKPKDAEKASAASKKAPESQSPPTTQKPPAPQKTTATAQKPPSGQKKPATQSTPLDQQPPPEEAADESVPSPKQLPSIRQINAAKALEEVKRTKAEHASLLERIDRLVEKIDTHKKWLAQMKPGSRSGISCYYHFMVCHAEQLVDTYKKYKMKEPHKAISNSKSTQRRLKASLDIYRDWLNTRKDCLGFKQHLKTLMQGSDDAGSQETVYHDARRSTAYFDAKSGSGRSSENPSAPVKRKQPAESKDMASKIKHHTLRLMQNMKLLEETLKNFEEVELKFHEISHKKLDGEEEKPPIKNRPIDLQRLDELATPRKIRLQSTLESFRKVMSREKQERIECQLGLDVVLEQLEETEQKSTQDRAKKEHDNAIKLLSQIESKLARDIFNEILGELKKKLPQMVRKWKEPKMVTSFWLNLRQNVFDLLLCSHGPPNDHEEQGLMICCSGAITDFIIKLKMQSMAPTQCLRMNRHKYLKSTKKNEFLIHLSHRLIRRLHCHAILNQTENKNQ